MNLSIKIFLLSITFLTFILIFNNCKKEASGNLPDSIKYTNLFNTSLFYNKIDSNPQIDPNSTTMVGSLIDEAGKKGFFVVVKEWTVPVFYADASTTKKDVRLTASWAPKKILKNVPIPDFVQPDPQKDGSMVIIDEINGCIYDFFQFRYSISGKISASWANALPLNSDGIFPKGFSARGSGFELLQGVIWPQELESGIINHALVFTYDHTKAGGPVKPATESDGTTKDSWAIPEGALVQLDPSLDLNSLDLTKYEMTIAKALQDYGMYLCDDGGGLQLYAVNPISCKTNPYQNIWGDQKVVYLKKIPFDKFRVLKLPPQTNNEPEIVSNSCATYK